MILAAPCLPPLVINGVAMCAQTPDSCYTLNHNRVVETLMTDGDKISAGTVFKLDVNALDSKNKTALNYAERIGNDKMIRFLKKYGALTSEEITTRFQQEEADKEEAEAARTARLEAERQALLHKPEKRASKYGKRPSLGPASRRSSNVHGRSPPKQPGGMGAVPEIPQQPRPSFRKSTTVGMPAKPANVVPLPPLKEPSPPKKNRMLNTHELATAQADLEASVLNIRIAKTKRLSIGRVSPPKRQPVSKPPQLRVAGAPRTGRSGVRQVSAEKIRNAGNARNGKAPKGGNLRGQAFSRY